MFMLPPPMLNMPMAPWSIIIMFMLGWVFMAIISIMLLPIIMFMLFMLFRLLMGWFMGWFMVMSLFMKLAAFLLPPAKGPEPEVLSLSLAKASFFLLSASALKGSES